MSLHGVARYALKTHAPTCVSRIHKTHACMRVCACVSRSKRPKRRREERAKWTVGNEFGTFMVCQPSLPSPPPPPSLSLSFSVASRGVCGCREQLVVEKHPRSLATPLAPRAPASLFRFLFSSSSADPPTIRLQPPCSKRSFDFYERINAPGHALFLCVSWIVSRTTPAPALCCFSIRANRSPTREKNGRERERERRVREKKERLNGFHPRHELAKARVRRDEKWENRGEKKGDTFTSDSVPSRVFFRRRRFKRHYPFTNPCSLYCPSPVYSPAPVSAFFG